MCSLIYVKNIKIQLKPQSAVNVLPSTEMYILIFSTVCAVKSPTMSDYLTGLENSGWLRHIKAIMDAGIFLVKVLLSPNHTSEMQCYPWC